MVPAPAVKSREQLEADWWKRWWAEDFSWEGLAKKPIYGAGGLHGEKSLQDYWRRDPAKPDIIRDDRAMESAGELIRAPGGKLWHLAHVPLTWQDGSPAKAALTGDETASMSFLFSARASGGRDTILDDRGGIEGPDGRAQFSGCVFDIDPLKGVGRSLKLNCSFDASWFRTFDGARHMFGPGTSFAKCFFYDTAKFDHAITNWDTSFRNARFRSAASFEGCKFNGRAMFDYCVFADEAEFSRAVFASRVRFVGVEFRGFTAFERTSFTKNTRFNECVFSGPARFANSVFARYVGFRRVVFESEVNFYNVRFEDISSFDGSFWNGQHRNWHSAFNSALFKGPASFRGLQSARKDIFPHAAFDRAAFERSVQIDTFTEKQADDSFNASLFGARDSAKEDARELVKRGGGSVSDLDPARKRPSKQRALDERPIEDRDNQHWAISGLWGPQEDVNDVWRFDDDEDSAARRRARIAPQKPSSSKSFLKFLGALPFAFAANVGLRRTESRVFHSVTLPRRLVQLERGCRVLKQEMAKSSDKSREQLYFRYELMARRAQPQTPQWEQLFSYLYELLSGYGSSIGRPIAALFALLILSAIFFGGVAVSLGLNVSEAPGESIVDALQISWNSIFRPFQAINEANGSQGPVSRLLASAKPEMRFLLSIYATLESLFAIILVFLLALAARRRFQIN
jgi:hypothetical protein